jgi:hypothetical protein
MATKSKKAAISKAPATVTKEEKQKIARAVLRPSVNAAAVISEYGKPFGELDVMALADVLAERSKEVSSGDMHTVEAMLIDQAYALQAIFMNFARRTLNQEYQKNLESFMRMALKAQNQCRMTLETLATVKNPPIVFAKQANIVNGPQQVNNGVAAPSRVREIENEQTQLSGGSHELLPDTRTSSDASRVNPALETLGKIDRAKIPRG